MLLLRWGRKELLRKSWGISEILFLDTGFAAGQNTAEDTGKP
jgi:hypothetical protein